jgi:hypothetical protein
MMDSMLVKFHSQAGASVTMFGDIAIALLRLMGMSGVVPGAALAAEVPEALRRLRQGLESVATEPLIPPGPQGEEGEQNSPRLSLRTRAYPLVQLIEAAAAKECDVIWEEDSKATG